MEPFRQFAVFSIVRDGSFVAVAAATLMLAFSFHPRLALLIGANMAFIFCICLGLRAMRLDAERVTRTEPWRGLERDERPEGEQGRHWACEAFRDLLLRSARLAALIAIVLSSSSLILTMIQPAAHQTLAAAGAHALEATTAR
ncbi:MAG TPA: hypothetical protein VHG33_03565 [Woeseiaceae bacterium]|nr:hypothetical protein [Woeseiaceae bacterium]